MQTRMKIRIQKRLLLYLFVFQVTSVWGLANRIYQAFNKNHKYDYFLLCMDSAFGPLQGFLNALVYGLNQKLRDRYVEWLCPDTTCWCVFLLLIRLRPFKTARHLFADICFSSIAQLRWQC
jgi:hypothetical protein